MRLRRHRRRACAPVAALVSTALLVVFPSMGGCTEQSTISIEMSERSTAVHAGERVRFDTIIKNSGKQPSPPIVLHLAIVELFEGVHVDPEDWSAQRTQFIDVLPPDASAQTGWLVDGLFPGTVGVYVTALSLSNASSDATLLATSEVLRIQITANPVLPLHVVLPVASIVPMLPLGLLLYLRRWRARRSGGAHPH